MYYVYEWFNKDTNEIFYVGKGCNNRYKSTYKRNLLFKEYINKNNCDCKIIKYFENEEEAFKYEHEKIINLKNIGQCSCNLDDGGFGGLGFIWTDEMRKYKSEYNPMKNDKQRQRMSKNNPMKNKEISEKVAKTKRRAVIIKNIYFESIRKAAEYFNRYDTQIQYWCKRGYDSDKQPCRYADEEQKEYKLKITNSRSVIVDGIKFESVKSAAKYFDVWSETIIRAIKNNRPFKGHVCKYDDQQPSQGKSDNSTLEGSTTNR